MAIKIKKSHKGLLHKNLGVPQDEKIPASKLKIKESDSSAVKKRKVFAQNAKKWHHPNGGFIKYEGGGNNNISGANESGMGTSGLSQDWGNAQTANQSKGLSRGAQTGISMASSFAQSTPQITATFKNPNADAGDKTGVTLNAAADAGIGAIPGFGAFYGAARGATSMGQNAMPGTTYYDKKTGKNIEIKDKPGYRALNHILEPDHSKMISDFSNAARVKDPKDKAAYVGMGFWNLMGAGNIVEPIMNATGKSMYDGLRDLRKPSMIGIEQENSKFPVVNPNMPQDTTQMAANGGFGGSKTNTSTHLLEKYKVLPHSQLNPNFANAHLDGKPIQLEKNETIFRAANGGDYAFSPNIKADSGKTIAEESIAREKLHSKPYYDKVAQDTLKLSLNNLVKENETKRIAKESKGLPKAAWGEFGPNIDNSTTNYKQAPQVPQWTQGQESQTTVPQIRGTEWDDNTVSVNPNVYTEYFKNDNNLNPNNYPLQNKYKPDLTIKTNSKTPIKTENNLTTGDYLQLAGQLPALGYNAAMAFKKPEKQKLYQDLSTITPNQQGIDLNPMFLAQNTATKGISEGTSSDAVRRANLANVVSGTQRNIADALLQNKNLNSNLRTQFEQRIADRSRFNIAQKLGVDDINAKNRAAQRMFGATAASNLGQGLTTFGIAKNQGKTNEIEYSTLQNLASNYGLDPKEYADFLKSKGIKIKYK